MKNTKDLLDWITLNHAHINLSRIQNLLSYFGSQTNICKATYQDLKQHKLTDFQIQILKNPPEKEIEKTLQWAQQPNHHIISFQDSHYPSLLSEISDAPPVIYVRGDINCIKKNQIALVGSRNPSHTGYEIAREFAFALSQSTLCITSGLALGIDTASHKGALEAKGETIAVLGSGLQTIYPKQNTKLAEQIVSQGALVSEFPLYETPIPRNFPRRNRIISGLSLGTLVIEAALKSGSLITAHFALEQNREVFAIPGSLRNANSKGCLSLIQQGAKCVMDINDILAELKINIELFSEKILSDDPNVQIKLDCKANPVLACIEYEVTTVDQICARSKLSAQIVTATLLELELKGLVKRYLNGFIKV